jgi:hypothetical protein
LDGTGDMHDYLNSIQSPLLSKILPPNNSYVNASRFRSIPNLHLYSPDKTYTRNFAGYAHNIFHSHALSNTAVILFFQVFLTEYFQHINAHDCWSSQKVQNRGYRANFKFFSYDPAEHNRYEELLNNRPKILFTKNRDA